MNKTKTKYIDQSLVVMRQPDAQESLKFIEEIGRTCYKSENRITDESYKAFIKNIVKRGHRSVIEHISITYRAITNRGVSHEMVRHRLASFTQESTRYCNYSNGEFIFIIPTWMNDVERDWVLNQPDKTNTDGIREQVVLWYNATVSSAETYDRMIECGCRPEDARGILPHDIKTELIFTMNLNELKHMLTLRSAPDAHPDIRVIANMVLDTLGGDWELIFGDVRGE